MNRSTTLRVLATAAVAILWSSPAHAIFHTWLISEIYSSADGTVQFVELEEHQGFNGQDSLSAGTFTSDGSSFSYLDLPSSQTANKNFIMGTQSYAASPGAVCPDYLLPDGFFAVAGDTLTFFPSPAGPVDEVTFDGVDLPSDGILALPVGRDGDDLPILGAGATNSPTNFAGETGSVNPGSADPVPDCDFGDVVLSVEVSGKEKLKLKKLLKGKRAANFLLELLGDGTWSIGPAVVPAALGDATVLDGTYTEKGTSGRKFLLNMNKATRSLLLDDLDQFASDENGSPVDVRKRGNAKISVKINKAETKVSVEGSMDVKGGEPEQKIRKGKWILDAEGTLDL